MRKRKDIVIDIDEKTKKTFKVKELTLKEIMALSQLNPLFAADIQAKDKTAEKDTAKAPDGAKKSEAEEEEGAKSIISQLLGDFTDFSNAAKGVIDKSCEFKIQELYDLPPSDIEKVLAGWKETNQTFLTWLEKVGLLEAVMSIIKGAILDFSETLAT